MRLQTGKQFEQLMNALLVFSLAGFDAMLQFKLDIDRESIAIGNDKKDIVLRVINYFDFRNQVELLLKAADESNPTDPTFKQLLVEFGFLVPPAGGNGVPAPVELGAGNPAAAVGEEEGDIDYFKDTILLSGDQPIVNREALRLELNNLRKDHRRVLVVAGERRSGRSYSLRLIDHGAKKYGYTPIYLDLLRLKPAEGDLSPEQIGEVIALNMGIVDPPPVRRHEQDSAWNLRFCAWLKGQLENKNTLYWVIIDHSDRFTLLPGVEDFLFELASQFDKMDKLRLVFLGFQHADRLGSDLVLTRPVSLENIQTITDEDLMEYFFTFFNQNGPEFGLNLENEEENTLALVKLTARSVNNVLVNVQKQQAEENANCYLACIKSAVEAEIARVRQ